MHMSEDYKELVEYLDGKFNKIEGDLSDFKGEMMEFKDDMYKFQDRALKDLEALKQEKAIADEQDKRKTRVLQVHNNALIAKKVLSDKEVTEIAGLGAF